METKSQVVVIKSVQGFADRLRTLNQALLYCLRYSAVLCVDWEDDTWGVPFDDIFGLVGVPYIHKKKVLGMLEHKKDPAKCRWTPKEVKMNLSRLIVRDPKFKTMEYCGGYCATDDDVRMNNPPPVEEVIVSNGYGRCLNEYKLLVGTLRFKPEVRDAIIGKLATMPERYAMVHLRGTDRSHSGFLKSMMDGVRKLDLPPVFVIGDNIEMIDEWLREFPTHREFRPESSIRKLGNAVSHTMSATELAKVGLTKRDMHIETLIDFFGLIKADERIGMKESYFFDTACRLGEVYWEAMLI